MTDTPYLDFCQTHRLPPQYLEEANQYFQPLIDHIVERNSQQPTVFVGINGSQGSGKSTLADYLNIHLSIEHSLQCAVISLDDFYLSKQRRQQLAKQVHPLLATRGVPGTHDTDLAIKTLKTLKQPHLNSQTVLLPRFNKAIDDVFPIEQWEAVETPVDIVILEGWCLGASPQEPEALTLAINELEANGDAEGVWRHYVNQQLLTYYAELFAYTDISVMLQAPAFSAVYQWRLEQEQKLAEKLQNDKQQRSNSQLMDAAQIAAFIQYFQRLTEHMLTTMPSQVDHCYQLNDERKIIHETHRWKQSH